MNRMNLRKVFIRLFIILIMNKSNGILKRHEIKSKKITDIERYENSRTFEVNIYRTRYKY